MKTIKNFFATYRKEILLLALFLVLDLFAFVFYSNVHILRFESNIVQANQENLKDTTTVTIFAGGMKKEQMTEHQRDRVIKGVRVYKSIDDVKQILITGDDGKRRVNEVDAMKALAKQMGVKSEDIIVDPHGYGTYESCHRTNNVFGIEKMAAVSQNFHLSRIAYICSNFGIKTLGISANLSEYDSSGGLREVLARAKAVWQTEITRPHPRYMWEVFLGY